METTLPSNLELVKDHSISRKGDHGVGIGDLILSAIISAKENL
jgi:hypothetical protein